MSGMAVASGDFGKLIEVRQKLKEIDTILYEVVRDFWVSGFPIDNNLIMESVDNADRWIAELRKKLDEIKRVASKSHITGE